MRIFLVAAQAAFLGLGYFAVAVLAAPFTAEGLVGTPSRVAGAVFIVSRMPLDGPTLLNVLKLLLYAPAISLVLAFLAGFPSLRAVRWAGAAVAVAGFVYFVRAFPGLLEFKAAPWPLAALLLLFTASALLFALLPENADAAFTRGFALAAQGLFCLATISLLWYSALSRNLPVQSLAMIAACTAGYCLAFYSLLRATWEKTPRAEPVAWGILAILITGFAWHHSPPMASPLLGGIAVWLAAFLP